MICSLVMAAGLTAEDERLVLLCFFSEVLVRLARGMLRWGSDLTRTS